MSVRSSRESWLAAASGLLLGAAFLPVPLPFLAWFAFVPLVLLLDDAVRAGRPLRHAFGIGYVGGLAFFLVGMHWIALLADVAMTVPVLKYAGWVLAAAYLALYWGLAGLFAAWLARRSGRSAVWTFVPAMMVVEEWRGSGDLGFPWFQPGYTQGALAPVLQLAALGSVTLVTLWVLVANGLIAVAWRARTRRSVVIALAWLALPALLPSAWPGAGPRPVTDRDPALNVWLVQGNIPGEIKWSGRHQREILDAFLSLSDSAVRLPAGPGPKLVVWPETATGSYLRKQPEQAIAVSEFANRTGTPVFSGYADYTFDPNGRVRPTNAAGLFSTSGASGESYAKRHLVPFGERMPFQWLIPALGKLDLGQAEWMPGTKTVLFPSAAGPFSSLVCFESIFPDLARDDVRAGSRWIVNVTNDEWFGNSAAIYQHAAIAPFRAVECGVPLVRCANTGLTVAYDAKGRETARAPVFEPTVLLARLSPEGARTWRPTPYVRFGDWPGVLAALACVALALGVGRGARKS